MTPISFAKYNSYFVKRRSFMMSLGFTVLGLGLAVYPILAQFTKTVYGFRRCLALIAAVNMHTFLGMLVMHPLEWHAKRVNVDKELLLNSKILSELKTLTDVSYITDHLLASVDIKEKGNNELINDEMEIEMVLMPSKTETRLDNGNSDVHKGRHKKSCW